MVDAFAVKCSGLLIRGLHFWSGLLIVSKLNAAIGVFTRAYFGLDRVEAFLFPSPEQGFGAGWGLWIWTFLTGFLMGSDRVPNNAPFPIPVLFQLPN